MATGNPFLFCGLLTALALSSVVLESAVQGQSNIVFMTADDQSLVSHLHRFDMGVQTFATNTGGNDAFLGVTILNGQVLVADFVGEQIERFSPDGTYLGPFASPGFSPTFLESDSSDNVYSTPISGLEPRIGRRFNSLGVVTQTFTHPDMIGIGGIDADAAGNVYIIENHADQLYRFAPDGTFLNRIPIGFDSPSDIAIDESANLLYAAAQNDSGAGIKIFDISGPAPSFLGSMATPASSIIVGVHFASESGNILGTDFGISSNDPRGLEFSPSGALLAEYRPINGEQAWDIATFVPEPSSMLMLGVGAVLLGFNARRRP